MERKIEIPIMSKEEIAKWYANIKPIVGKATKSYLRNLSEKEITGVAYTWLTEPGDLADPVDFSKLSVLADVKMLHRWCYYGFFKPDVGEVIRQIPKELLEKVVAFEILDGAIGWDTIYNKECNAGFQVSIVRLYQAKDATNEEAKKVDVYPTKDSNIPIGMTQEEFEEYKELYVVEE